MQRTNVPVTLIRGSASLDRFSLDAGAPLLSFYQLLTP